MEMTCPIQSSTASIPLKGKLGNQAYYPVNDAKNSALYVEYKKLAATEQKVIFNDRLGEYKYDGY